jgi:hypothetical protein
MPGPDDCGGVVSVVLVDVRIFEGSYPCEVGRLRPVTRARFVKDDREVRLRRVRIHRDELRPTPLNPSCGGCRNRYGRPRFDAARDEYSGCPSGYQQMRVDGADRCLRLDKATAAVLAEDIELADPGLADSDFVFRRCFRVGIRRVDCVMAVESVSGRRDLEAWVRTVRLVGLRFHFGRYDVQERRGYTRANTVRLGPPGSRTRPIARLYRRFGARYDPRFLIKSRVRPWGRPQLASLLLKQCALQPRLPCH